MTAAWRAGWAEVRAGVRGLMLMALVLAVVAGASLAAVAGARRTDTVVERYFGPDTNAGDFVVSLPPDDDLQADVIDAVEAIPGVQAAARATYFISMLEGTSLADGPPTVEPFVAVDPEWSTEVDGVGLVEGRLADQHRSDEVTVTESAARNLRLDVGDEVTLLGWSAADGDPFEGGITEPGAIRSSFRVTGIVRDDITPGGDTMYLTSAWFEKTGKDAVHFGPALVVSARDRAAVRTELERIVRDVIGGSPEDLEDAVDGAMTIDRAARVQAVALLGFALVAGILGAIVTGQSVARQDVALAATLGSLSALGLRRRDLVVVPLVRVGVVAVTGIAGGVIFAVAASTVFPLGTVRNAEPFPGARFDALVLLPGALVLLVAVALTALPGVVRAARLATVEGADVAASGRARALPSWLGAAPRVGVNMALDPGQGRTAIPVRSVLAGAVIGVVAVTAAAVFWTSLSQLTNDPERRGWNVDLVLGSQDSGAIEERYTELLDSAPWAGEWRGVATAMVVSRGVELPVFGFGDGGALLPPIIEGRAPVSDREIALGREDMASIGASIGDTIELEPVTTSGFATEVKIVGMSVLPSGLSSPGQLGHGAVASQALVRRLDTSSEVNQFFVRLAPGHTIDDALDALGEGAADAALPNVSDDIANVDRVRGVPTAIAAVLALVALGSLGHALITGVRRRRADFAVLRSLGFVKRQVIIASLVQALTLAALALVVGIPLGTVAGRAAWGLIARSLGVADDATVAVFDVVVAIPVFLVAMSAIALASGVRAARLAPAAVLRVE